MKTDIHKETQICRLRAWPAADQGIACLTTPVPGALGSAEALDGAGSGARLKRGEEGNIRRFMALFGQHGGSMFSFGECIHAEEKGLALWFWRCSRSHVEVVHMPDWLAYCNVN